MSEDTRSPLCRLAPLHKLVRFEAPVGVTIYGDDHGDVHAVADTALDDMSAIQIAETFTDSGVLHIRAGETLELPLPPQQTFVDGKPRLELRKFTPKISEYGFAYGLRVLAGFVRYYDLPMWVVVDR